MLVAQEIRARVRNAVRMKKVLFLFMGDTIVEYWGIFKGGPLDPRTWRGGNRSESEARRFSL